MKEKAGHDVKQDKAEGLSKQAKTREDQQRSGGEHNQQRGKQASKQRQHKVKGPR